MKPKDFYVVGIGASAGGLDAVKQFFDHLPEKTGNAYIVIQHLSPDFKSLMPELLAKHTKMEIFTAGQDQEIQPDCIYLNKRDKDVGIKNNRFILLDKAPKDHLNFPIDILFHMLGESYKDKAIGVILSGTGSDGSRGIKTIKEAGGTILVQKPESAQFNGMPNSAISTNLADFILPPNEIAQKIAQFTGKRLKLQDTRDNTTENEKILHAILSEIQRHSRVDYKKYKTNTLIRRLEKRMNLHNIDSMEGYLSFLKQNENERIAITQEFLIGVTGFFRDKSAFVTLRNTVVPAICRQKTSQDTIRIWIPGCSSGEEVYSLAILFEDYIRNNKPGIDYKIFATDIDRNALNKASTGSYPVNNCAEINKDFLEEYFLKTGEKIQIVKRIREKIVFSYHDVTNDPPFIKMDLISCRNLLIYLTNIAQKSVLSGFQYALNKNGFLFLGGSESLGSISSLFKVIDTKHKIFQNLHDNKTSIRITGENSYSIGDGNIHPSLSLPQSEKSSKQNELFFYKYLSKKHAPVSVFIDSEFTVSFIQGDFRKWFSQSDGVFTNNILKMVNAELATILRNGIRRLSGSKKTASIKNLVFTIDDEKVSTDIYFEKTEGTDQNILYLIQLGISPPDNPAEQIILSNEDISNFSKQRIEDLEFELKETRAELQSVVEELEASNEELQSSNEELMSSNEELQSSNEELQSVNEELYTVNTEFQEKNKELENLNNDINNLLNSTDIGTLFLDTNLNIRKFTPAIKRIFNLEESDLGRSIASFASEFTDQTRNSIISDSKIALEKLESFEKEIQDNKGNWYLKRISPFITSEKKIEGIVITFVDISSLKKARHDLSESEQRLTTALEAGNMAWWELKMPSGKIVFNKKKTQMLGYSYKDFSHHNHFLQIIHPDDVEIVNQELQNHLSGKSEKYECQYRMKNADGYYQWFHSIGKIVSKNPNQNIVSGFVIEITSKKLNEIQLLEAKKKAEAANIYKDQFLANMSHEIRTPLNGLLGFAKLLRNDNLDEETRNTYVDIIESNSNQLLNLINDIIDVSKIEAGELNINFQSCHLGNMFIELEATYNELKRRKGKDNLEIRADVPDSLNDLIINTDPVRLRQVLTNLIGNAIKFTNEGSIEFGYTLNKNRIVFEVSDTGIGIPEDKYNVIFERFQQLENPVGKTKYDGTGLGLAIAKGIIHLLGGVIRIDSEEGKGTVFTFEIPYKPAYVNNVISNNTENINKGIFKGKQILIAEDDSFNRFYLKELLSELSLDILWAENGADAVELFKKNNGLSVALMDIRMPVVDGFDAIKQILEFKPDARIIAQTAFALASDKKKCLQSGFVDYISKPIQKEQLMEVITKWIV